MANGEQGSNGDIWKWAMQQGVGWTVLLLVLWFIGYEMIIPTQDAQQRFTERVVVTNEKNADTNAKNAETLSGIKTILDKLESKR